MEERGWGSVVEEGGLDHHRREAREAAQPIKEGADAMAEVVELQLGSLFGEPRLVRTISRG
jgi:hypothetical protein